MSTNSPSPPRARSPIDHASGSPPTSPGGGIINETYRNAMKKLVDAAWKFDKESNDYYFKSLENRQLDKELFRQGLRQSMNCKLTPAEFDSLYPLFKNKESDIYVDGCEFILLFYRVRYEYRSKLLTERIAIEKRYREQNMELELKRRAELEKKTPIRVSFEFNEQDTANAISKMTEAAVLYDRNMPGAVQLDAFDCEYMTPEVFNSTIRKTFNLNLSPPELGAFIKWLNSKNNKDEVTSTDNINCAKFLVLFFRTGFHTRNERTKKIWAEKKRINDERERKRLEDLAEAEKKNSLKCNLDFTNADKESATMRLKLSAKLYDKANPGSMSMDAFDVKHMPPHVFKEQLKRVFNLKVTPGELGALMDLFDTKKTGLIPCPEFAKYFLALGISERDREAKEWLEKQRKENEEREIKDKAKQEALAKKNSMKFSYSYDENDYQNAVLIIEEAAWRYDKSMPGAASLEAFDTKTMPPHIFKEQAKRAFNMNLSPAELGATLKYFNGDAEGNIVCKDFLNKFLRIGIEFRHKKHAEWLKLDAQLTAIRIKQEEDKLLAQEKKVVLTDVSNFTEDDFKSALNKLTIAATKYIPVEAVSPLTAFETAVMPPHVFKEQLKLAFNIKLSMKELSALISYFDKEGKGIINCKDFLMIFYRTGYDERNRIRSIWRKEIVEKDQQRKIEEEERLRQNLARNALDVDFDFSESDFDSALMKIVNMCRLFDKRQLGPAGFAAFTSESLSPAEFKEMGKRTFNLKVTPGELGAIVKYYDINGKGSVNCNAFLNSFVQIRVQCEEFKGKRDEDERVSEYHAKLKEAYKFRLQKQVGGHDSKQRPWRAKVPGLEKKVINKNKATATSVKVQRPAPKNMNQKIKLRLIIGRENDRLDLSAYATSKSYTVNTKEATESSNDVIDNVDAPATATIPGSNHEYSLAALVETKLDALPLEVYSMQNLRELWLDNNNIVNLSPEISNLVLLKKLSICGNGLTIIPPEIMLLEGLEVLNLRRNQLKVLPELFKRFTNLKELYLGSNQFTEIPAIIFTLQKLTLLDFSQNLLTSVPLGLHKLKGLTYFNLDKNNIKEPPKVFGKMHWLDVVGCSIPPGEKSSCKFQISVEEEQELQGMITSRAKRTASMK